VLRWLLGDYGMRTPAETLLAKRDRGIPNDVARLRGARFVSASETNEGARLDEAFLKDLTGGDTMSARFLRAE
jgi:putative DNA primase/helicase